LLFGRYSFLDELLGLAVGLGLCCPIHRVGGIRPKTGVFPGRYFSLRVPHFSSFSGLPKTEENSACKARIIQQNAEAVYRCLPHWECDCGWGLD